jgi:hypothetical protein
VFLLVAATASGSANGKEIRRMSDYLLFNNRLEMNKGIT